VNWFSWFRRRLRKPLDLLRRDHDEIKLALWRVQEAVGRVEARQLGVAPARPGIQASEFQVFSQWGEDGILHALTRRVPVSRKLFVEFGVGDYRESSTRFLLTNAGWAGLVMDRDPECMARLRESEVYWHHPLKAAPAFVTAENIDELLISQGVSGDIGLLCIDIDGNDYWVWKALRAVSPAIVSVEYNARFGPTAAVAVPYAPAFERARAHPSLIYYGASLGALCALAAEKGYDFVGCCSAGVNAFFVRADLRPADLPALTAAEGYVPAGFSEARDGDGRLVKMTLEQERALLETLPQVEVG